MSSTFLKYYKIDLKNLLFSIKFVFLKLCKSKNLFQFDQHLWHHSPKQFCWHVSTCLYFQRSTDSNSINSKSVFEDMFGLRNLSALCSDSDNDYSFPNGSLVRYNFCHELKQPCHNVSASICYISNNKESVIGKQNFEYSTMSTGDGPVRT